MSLASDLAAIEKLDDFEGGIRSAREKDNKVVAAVNAIRQAGLDNPEPAIDLLNGVTPVRVAFAEDGNRVFYNVLATKLRDS